MCLLFSSICSRSYYHAEISVISSILLAGYNGLLARTKCSIDGVVSCKY